MLGLKGILLVMLKSAFIVAFLSIPKPVVGFAGLKNWSRKALYTKVDLCTQSCYSQIIPGLYLSNAKAASDFSVLKHLHITHILTVNAERLPSSTFVGNGITNLFIMAYDNYETNLLPYFPIANTFIDDGMKKGTVIVHCRLGVSRSATIIIAYLMQKYNLKYEQAFWYVRSRRNFINPNPGFVKQLRAYEQDDFYVSHIKRLDAYLKVNSGENKYKMVSAAMIMVGIMLPVAVLLV